MKKSIFLFFAAILCAIGMNAADITSDGTARLYFNMNAVSWWKSSNGENNFAYFFKDSNSAWSAHSVQHSGNTYYVIIPKGTWNTVILTRNDTKTSPSWSNKWNQTGDTPLSSTSNYISTFSDGGKGTFGTAVKPVSTASVASSSASVFVGAPANLTAALTSNADINTVKSVAYSTTTGASISGSTFTATAEGTYTVTATVTYHPNGYPSITSTATATTDITVTVPAEEVHDVTVSYMCGSTEIADETKISSVGVETEGDAVAPAKIKGYNFVNWTIGDGVINQTGDNTAREIKINTKSTGTYTLIANYEPETVYFVNTDEWAVVNVYAWVEDGIKNGEWPGEELTPTGEKIGGYDVYRYTSGEGYENVIFNDKVGSNASKQTPDLVWTNGKYYVYNGQTSVDADDWYAKVDVEGALPDWFATNVYLVGSMFANWDKTPDKEFRKATKDATTANIVVNLDANKEYELKVRRGDDWTSCTSKITNTVSNLQFSTSNNDNCKMKTTVAGDYTFTWTINSSKLAVTYPTIYAITATANDAAMGTIAGAGNYGKGSTATLTATPNDGYLFVNWTKGGVEVATTQEYSFKVTEAVELVANFEAAPEEVHNVTVSYVCGGNKIAEDQTVAAVGETTAKTVEAPAIFGYTFSSWTLGEGVTSTDATANPISINIVAGASDFTLTANYTEIPKVTVYFVNNKKWSKVHAYGWKDGEMQGTPAWPGQEITANKEAEQIAGFDVYSYSVVPDSYDNIIFHNGSGTQTETFKWTDGKYYYMDAADKYAGGTAEEVATALGAIVSYDYYIAGNMNGWNKASADYGMTDEDADGIYEKEITLAAGQDHQFKVTNGKWGNEDGGFDCATVEGAYEEVDSKDGNVLVKLNAETTFIVKFDKNAKEISFEGLTEKAPEPTFDYYIVGSFNGDNPKKAENGMTLDGTVYKATVTLAVGDNTLKVTKGSWDPTWGYNELGAAYEEVSDAGAYNNIKITLAAEKSITVIFDATAGKITFDGLTEKAPVVEDLSKQPSVLYFHPSNQWKEGDARFAAYFFGTEEKWVSMTDVDEDGIYEVVNDKKNKNVIFCRMNPANNENQWGENGSHKWNQSADLEIPTTTYLNYWMVAADNTTWDSPEGKWMMLIGSGDNSEALAAADEQTVEDVYVNRSFTAGQLYTIALPFALSEALTKTHFGSTVSVIKFTQLEKDANGDLVLWFNDALGMAAGKPYLITPSVFVDGFVVNNVVIKNAVDNIELTTTGASVTMEAVLSASKNATNNGRYWLASNTYLYNTSTALKSLRAVFNVQTTKANVRARVAFGENVETGIEDIFTTDAPVKAIVNGQLIIIRDGVKYNVQGQKL